MSRPAGRATAAKTTGRATSAKRPPLIAGTPTEVIDIDAIVVAQREQQQYPPLRWRGRLWTIPSDISFATIETMVSGAVIEGLAGMLGAEVLTLDPPVGVREAKTVIQAVSDVMGITPGESEGS